MTLVALFTSLSITFRDSQSVNTGPSFVNSFMLSCEMQKNQAKMPDNNCSN